jgi:hypothetical protein
MKNRGSALCEIFGVMVINSTPTGDIKRSKIVAIEKPEIPKFFEAKITKMPVIANIAVVK